MQYRTLARSGIAVSPLAFGTMRFVPKDASSGQGWEAGERALNAAIDGGVNLIHSNSAWPTYPATQRFLSRHPQRGELQHIIKLESPDYHEVEFDPDRFRTVVDAALRALHTDRIAIVQHLQRGPECPKSIAYDAAGDERRLAGLQRISEQVGEVAEELVAAGKIGEVATFPHTPGFAAGAIEAGVYGSVVHFYSLLETEMVPLLDDIAARGMSFIGLRPFVQGLATDLRADRRALPEEDPRRAERYEAWYARLAEIRAHLGIGAGELTSTALRFALAHPAVTSVAVGLNTVDQVAAALRAVAEPPLDPALVTAAGARNATLPRIAKDTLFG